jgi:hypothetical protein
MSRGGRRHPVARCAGLRPPPDPLSGFSEDPLTARRDRRRDQYRSDCRMAGGTTTGNNTDLALCGTGACARPPRGDPRRLNRAPTPLPDCFARCRQHISILYYKNYFSNIKSKKARLRDALVSYEGLTNSIRPLFTHETRGAISPVCYAQKLSPQINVELVGGLEVFGWDRCASHLHIALVLSSLYGIGDARRKTWGKDLRDAMERRL